MTVESEAVLFTVVTFNHVLPASAFLTEHDVNE